MKSILVIDESAQFREYMRFKLESNNIETTTAANALEGVSKTKSLRPDLIVLDYHLSKRGYLEVLKGKQLNPATAKTPVIVLAQEIDQRKILELVSYHVKKVFTKPVKIDVLFATLSEILGVPVSLDKSPGIVEVHVNDDIIFIEIAQGLNEDKLDLLKFKIIELIELYEIRVPKVILMLVDTKLTHADAPNMMKLLETVIHASRTRAHYIRILTRDGFVGKFLEGQEEYKGIKVVDNLGDALEGLISALHGGGDGEGNDGEIIGEKVLASTGQAETESVALRFDGEGKRRSAGDPEASLKEFLQDRTVAVVDDDPVIRELMTNTFRHVGVKTALFADGADFLAALEGGSFDLVFLDLMMPQVGGFAVLEAIRSRGLSCPVIVLSSITQRETVIRAFQMGIKSYLSKPMKPADIFKKALEILRPGL